MRAARCVALLLYALGAHARSKQALRWQDQMRFTDRMIAGASARGAAQTLLHPIDVMRTRIQAKGLTTVLTPKLFLKGVTPQVTLAFPAGALQFVAYEWCKDKMAAVSAVPGAAREILCAAAGAMAASVVRVPQEVLKQRVQADVYPNALTGFTRLISTEGPKGLYTGYFATISRDVPWNALSFMFFAQSKALFTKITGETPTTNQNLMLGAFSGMAAAVIMTPVDVVKTRLMVGSAAGKGIAATMTSIVKEEGAATLMKGVVPRVLYLAPLASMTLSFYEAFGQAIIKARNAREDAAKQRKR